MLSNCPQSESSHRVICANSQNLCRTHTFMTGSCSPAQTGSKRFSIFSSNYTMIREIGGARIAVIGPATAQRVKDFHLHVDLQPNESVAEDLVREFKKQGSIENLKILLVRAEKARDVLPKELSALGAIVDEAFA